MGLLEIGLNVVDWIGLAQDRKIINYGHGFQLGVGGYNSKQHVLLDKIMEKLTNFKIDPKRFEILKENVSIGKAIFIIYVTYWNQYKIINLIMFILLVANLSFLYTFIAYTF
jgi:hypothetical protein